MATKKAERAARIAADKLKRWKTRVRSLTGHMIYDRAREDELNDAYAAKRTADAYAAVLASREPVGKVVHPLKVDAVERAKQRAGEYVERIKADLVAHGWDIEQCAPYPDGHMNVMVYRTKLAKYHDYQMVTRGVDSGSYRPKEPRIVRMHKEGIDHMVKKFVEAAAFQYDAFICKLVMKVGEVIDAKLAGSHVWAESTLTVTKQRDGVVFDERWRTHQIENVSKYGLYFPQWPTRLLKR